MPFAGNGADGHAAAPEKPQLALLSALPNDCPTYTWANFRHLESMANEVYQQLKDKKESGNQYLVVLGLTKDVITTLLNDGNIIGGIGFRMMSEDAVGVLKIIASPIHACATDTLTRFIDRHFWDMGLYVSQYLWGGKTAHPYPRTERLTERLKQPDQCFWPAARYHANAWPTLVVETGVGESLPTLRADACWWFENSKNDTRIVIVLAVKKSTRTIIVEKWQPAPQFASDQQPYCAQELVITPAAPTVTGAPLYLPFELIMDRPAVGNEKDITMDVDELLCWVGTYV